MYEMQPMRQYIQQAVQNGYFPQQYIQHGQLNPYPVQQSLDFAQWQAALQSSLARQLGNYTQNGMYQQAVATLMQNALRPTPLWFWSV